VRSISSASAIFKLRVSLLEGLDNPEEAVDVKHLQEGVSHSVKRLTRWTARVDTMSSITDCNMVDAFEESTRIV
jgi:hypothetical protein